MGYNSSRHRRSHTTHIDAVQGGVLSDLTAKSMTELTHPKMFEYFEQKWGWSQERFMALDPVVTNCNGAFSAWSHEGEIGQQAMDRWEECSMDKVRIALLNDHA